MSKINLIIPAPNRDPPQLVDSPARRKSQHDIFATEGSEEEGNISVRVGEVLACVGVGKDNIATCLGGFSRGPSQEESIWTLSIIGEAFDEDIAGVKGIDIATNIVIKVFE